jgi:thioester reductase-like protein
MMTNFLEENILPDKSLVKQRIKLLTNQLYSELQKPVDHFLLELKEDGHQDGVYEGQDMTELFQIATTAMEHYFRLSLQIEDMDDIKKQGITTQLNIFLKSYGLETMDIPTY